MNKIKYVITHLLHYYYTKFYTKKISFFSLIFSLPHPDSSLLATVAASISSLRRRLSKAGPPRWSPNSGHPILAQNQHQTTPKSREEQLQSRDLPNFSAADPASYRPYGLPPARNYLLHPVATSSRADWSMNSFMWSFVRPTLCAAVVSSLDFHQLGLSFLSSSWAEHSSKTNKNHLCQFEQKPIVSSTKIHFYSGHLYHGSKVSLANR